MVCFSIKNLEPVEADEEEEEEEDGCSLPEQKQAIRTRKLEVSSP